MLQTVPVAKSYEDLLKMLAIPGCVLVLVLCLQFLSFAYSRELAGDPDEPAHYITGLLFHDYISGGMPGKPMAFAENYYLHYPKIALGHWPPLFYVVQTIWTLPFGVSRTSLMLLMALLTTTFVVMVQRAVMEKHGLISSLIAATLLACLPAILYGGSRVMSDPLEALLSFAALRSWEKHLRTGSPWKLGGFVCFAALAILTKGTGLFLAVVPCVSLLLLRRFRMFAQRSFWLSGLAVAALCLPAYTLLPNTGVTAFRSSEGIRWDFGTIGTFPGAVVAETGPVAAVLIGVAVAICLWSALRGAPIEESLAVACAAVAGLMVLRVVVFAATASRHLAILAGPFMQLLAFGAVTIAGEIRRWKPAYVRSSVWIILAAATGAFFVTSFARYPKIDWGIGPLVSELLADPAAYGNVFLISSDSAGEGAVISETAMREARPGHYVLRATQALAEESWSGRRFRPRFTSSEEIGKYLDSVPVSTVILLERPDMVWRPYQIELRQLLRANPNVWSERQIPPVPPRDTLCVVYRRVIPVDTAHPHIVVNPAGKLGKPLHN